MILIGGENLIDLIQDPPDGGHPAYRAIPGGAPFNVAKAVARQSAEVGYLTPFSSDVLGQTLRDDLGREANMRLLADPSDKPTSLAVVSLTDGQAQYQFYREGTAERDVTAARLQASIPITAEAFFVGSLAITGGPDADAWEALYMAQVKAGRFVALDPNIRAPFIHDRAGYLARLDRMLAQADLVKLSDEDIAWIMPGETPAAALRKMAENSSADLIVLTMGGDGAIAMAGGRDYAVPAAPVPDFKDTVGAGDTFMGTLLAQTRRMRRLGRGGLKNMPGDEVETLLTLAGKAAAINCGRSGCNPPTLDELTR